MPVYDLKRADGTAVLNIQTDSTFTSEDWQHGVIWHGVDTARIRLGDAHWYGQGMLVNQDWPLESLAQYRAPFLTSDNGATGLSGILHPFWLNSDGGGVLVEHADAITTSFNAPLNGQPPHHTFAQDAWLTMRPAAANEQETDGLLVIEGERLTLRFFALSDARAVTEAFWAYLRLNLPPLPEFLAKPLWTTWAQFKNDISQAKILEFVENIRQYDFPISILGIDAKWQDEFGNARFDREKFPDPQAMIDTLHAQGIKTTLWCIPFYVRGSESHHAAIEQDFVIRQGNGQPYIGDWWDDGKIAFLDTTNPAALSWHLGNFKALATSHRIDGFKFDAGEGMFYNMNGAVHRQPMPPNHMNNCYTQAISEQFPWSDVRSGWRAQGQPLLFRQWDKSSVWSHDNGLASCITGAMTLNLLGYPNSFPDMIGGNEYGDQRVDAELMIRWTQAVAPMPIIQFSRAPWEFGADCAAICARYAKLHQTLFDPRRSAVLPIWWLAPQDENALVCNDQYLVGEDLLVAPVIVPKARQRDIYLPPGRWQSYWDAAEIHQGSAWLRNYPAPLEVLPLFQRIP